MCGDQFYRRKGYHNCPIGPLLFLIYINDLPSVTKNDCYLFADDISIIMTCNNKNEIDIYESEINNEINTVVNWLEDNNLQVNIKKTSFMQFSLSNRSNNYSLKINYTNTQIEEALHVNFLGVLLDKNLKWKEHVDMVCQKIDRYVYVLYRLRKTALQSTVLAAYHGYVASVLRYGLILWGNSSEANRAFIAQKTCLRAMTGAFYLDSCEPLFKELRILPFPCMYIYEICIFVKQHDHLFTKARDIYPRNTRNGDRLVIAHKFHNASYGKCSYVMCIKIFNKLPPSLRVLPVQRFKKDLFTWLIDKCFYSINEMLTH
ncbi:uncharacterized protein LOC126973715 [Leptidea sinapis]|uniref:uncharacterized protein LOC126973715 n=1 Tax=Leptidea sinapis TaxID=189913 RepID=UPI0021C30928|nr:uncharacterized protein LOC126973715 [Leptidea sinapis]